MQITLIKSELKQSKLCSFCYCSSKSQQKTYQTQQNNNVNLDTDSRRKQISSTKQQQLNSVIFLEGSDTPTLVFLYVCRSFFVLGHLLYALGLIKKGDRK